MTRMSRIPLKPTPIIYCALCHLDGPNLLLYRCLSCAILVCAKDLDANGAACPSCNAHFFVPHSLAALRYRNQAAAGMLDR